MNLFKKIPTVIMPSISDYYIEDIDEEIVSLSELGFICESQYYKQKIRGSYLDCYVRETVAKQMLYAKTLLPENLEFKIFDGYRPICIQQKLWNFYRNIVVKNNPLLNDNEIDFKTSFFVSKPSLDENKPSLHNTGGAIDLTLMKNGKELNMGTKFDDFSDKSWTNHFEIYELNDEVMNNRRILYNIMTEAGFTNLPSEWWHYDYGTKFWGYFKNKNALYKGILDIDFPNRI